MNGHDGLIVMRSINAPDLEMTSCASNESYLRASLSIIRDIFPARPTQIQRVHKEL